MGSAFPPTTYSKSFCKGLSLFIYKMINECMVLSSEYLQFFRHDLFKESFFFQRHAVLVPLSNLLRQMCNSEFNFFSDAKLQKFYRKIVNKQV